jgi:hypothetical protein
MDFLTQPVPIQWWHLIVAILVIWYLVYNGYIKGVTIAYEDPVDKVIDLVKPKPSDDTKA